VSTVHLRESFFRYPMLSPTSTRTLNTPWTEHNSRNRPSHPAHLIKTPRHIARRDPKENSTYPFVDDPHRSIILRAVHCHWASPQHQSGSILVWQDDPTILPVYADSQPPVISVSSESHNYRYPPRRPRKSMGAPSPSYSRCYQIITGQSGGLGRRSGILR
jgi:hypothetical protein